MKSQKNKKCSYTQKSEKGIKVTVNTVIEQAYKAFDSELSFRCVG